MPPGPMITAHALASASARSRAGCQASPGIRFQLSSHGRMPLASSRCAISTTAALSSLACDRKTSNLASGISGPRAGARMSETSASRPREVTVVPHRQLPVGACRASRPCLGGSATRASARDRATGTFHTPRVPWQGDRRRAFERPSRVLGDENTFVALHGVAPRDAREAHVAGVSRHDEGAETRRARPSAIRRRRPRRRASPSCFLVNRSGNLRGRASESPEPVTQAPGLNCHQSSRSFRKSSSSQRVNKCPGRPYTCPGRVKNVLDELIDVLDDHMRVLDASKMSWTS